MSGPIFYYGHIKKESTEEYEKEMMGWGYLGAQTGTAFTKGSFHSFHAE